MPWRPFKTVICLLVDLPFTVAATDTVSKRAIRASKLLPLGCGAVGAP